MGRKRGPTTEHTSRADAFIFDAIRRPCGCSLADIAADMACTVAEADRYLRGFLGRHVGVHRVKRPGERFHYFATAKLAKAFEGSALRVAPGADGSLYLRLKQAAGVKDRSLLIPAACVPALRRALEVSDAAQ